MMSSLYNYLKKPSHIILLNLHEIKFKQENDALMIFCRYKKKFEDDLFNIDLNLIHWEALWACYISARLLNFIFI